MTEATLTRIYVDPEEIPNLTAKAVQTMLQENPKLAALTWVNSERELRVYRIRATVEDAVCMFEAAKQTEMQRWGEKIE